MVKVPGVGSDLHLVDALVELVRVPDHRVGDLLARHRGIIGKEYRAIRHAERLAVLGAHQGAVIYAIVAAFCR